MANKYDEPPAYTQGGPQQPQPSYQGQGYNQGYQQGYPPQGGYYQQNPQMGYYQQQQGPYPPQQGYYGPGGYPQQGGYYQDRRSGPGCFEALLASLACCCCLDICLF